MTRHTPGRAARRRGPYRPKGGHPESVRRVGPRQFASLRQAAHLLDRPVDARAARAYLKDRRNVLLVAYDGATAVGFLRGTQLGRLDSPRDQMFLYEVGVRPVARRRGFGRRLVEALLRYCRDRGFQEVFVLADPRNTAAVRLYRSTGARPETRADRMFVYRLRSTGPAGRRTGSGRPATRNLISRSSDSSQKGRRRDRNGPASTPVGP